MIFRILGAILHLGNVDVVQGGERGDDAESCVVQPGDPHIEMMCELLGIDCEQIAVWLCNRKIESMAGGDHQAHDCGPGPICPRCASQAHLCSSL
uniref:Putative myosin vaa n=1 Tax=Ixodes ricinus TaxID=34613 RepID=A0A0K8RDN6_IXORI